ncbi:hypothetical protein [Litchfieldella qijiaojingensis]|uniref:phage nozzle protein n=1 Tax=Litchfieldella qijiaojingensis TaxID=980347 RepID=UPI001E3756B4|nr:hypothetical protein [Halomonas qijiaojingensis]
MSSIAEGLRKRPAFRHVAKMLGTQIGNAYVHVINRDKSERYVVTIYDGDIRVFDIYGYEMVVNKPDGVGYLSSSTPSEDFDTITVADYTFIVNKTVTAAKSSTLSPTRDNEAMIWIKQGAYGATYTATVNGTTASYTTPDGGSSADSTKIATDYIASQLEADLDAAFGTAYTIYTVGSVIYIKRSSGSVTVSSEDSLGNTAIQAIGEKIQRFSELPATAVEGFEVEVTGDQSSNFDNYYVKYQDGVWVETIKQGQEIGLDTSTMPHALVREADGTFTFREITWEDRKVGDLNSNPFPSYIGMNISGVFFHRNRLGVISGENVVMSKAGDFFNFFRGTATQVLDDDPIDVGVSHVKVSILRHAVPFNETLLLFSDQTQFQLGRANILTPDTVSINQTTEYETSLRAKPGAAGRFVYFMVNRGGSSGVMEYYVDKSTEVQEAADVTGHVPEYIPGDVFKIASSSNEDALVILSEQEQNAAYVYRYYWSDQEKIQASWSKWTIPEGDRILNAEFIESDLYAVIERDDGVYLEVASFEPGYKSPGMPSAVHLDRLLDETQVSSLTFDGTDTTFTLPYKIGSGQELVVVAGDGGNIKKGVVLKSSVDNSGTETVVTVSGKDLTSEAFFVGTRYTFRYRFSQLALRESSDGGGQSTVNSGRTQVRKMNLQFSEAGYFKIEVTPFRRQTYEYVFSGRVLGSARNLIGDISIEDGTFPFPIMARNTEVTIDITNDSYLPASFLSAEWEAYFTTRSKRI